MALDEEGSLWLYGGGVPAPSHACHARAGLGPAQAGLAGRRPDAPVAVRDARAAFAVAPAALVPVREVALPRV